MATYEFTIDGYIVPYTRMTARGKHSPRAQRYLASQQAMRLQFQTQMAAKGWDVLPEMNLGLIVTIYQDGRNRWDISNVLKAIEDAGNGVVWPDDRYIQMLHVIARPQEDTGPRTWVFVVPMREVKAVRIQYEAPPCQQE